MYVSVGTAVIAILFVGVIYSSHSCLLVQYLYLRSRYRIPLLFNPFISKGVSRVCQFFLGVQDEPKQMQVSQQGMMNVKCTVRIAVT